MKKQGIEREEVRFGAMKNSKLACKDCIFNNSESDLAVLQCAIYSTKPMKVLMGNKCEEKVTETEL